MSANDYVRVLPDFSALAAQIDAMSAAFRRASADMRKNAMHMYWHNKILFADTAKERRLMRREYARAMRRPTLIHKGRKP